MEELKLLVLPRKRDRRRALLQTEGLNQSETAYALMTSSLPRSPAAADLAQT